jgi:chromosome segregation ATPase
MLRIVMKGIAVAVILFVGSCFVFGTDWVVTSARGLARLFRTQVDTAKSFEQRVAELEVRKEGLERDLADAARSLGRTQYYAESWLAERERLGGVVRQTAEQVRAYVDHLRGAAGEMIALGPHQFPRAEVKQRLERKTSELARQRQELAQATAQAQTFERLRASMRASVDKGKMDHAALEDELKRLKTDIEAAKLNRRVAELASVLRRKGIARSQLAKDLEALRAEVEAAKAETAVLFGTDEDKLLDEAIEAREEGVVDRAERLLAEMGLSPAVAKSTR